MNKQAGFQDRRRSQKKKENEYGTRNPIFSISRPFNVHTFTRTHTLARSESARTITLPKPKPQPGTFSILGMLVGRFHELHMNPPDRDPGKSERVCNGSHLRFCMVRFHSCIISLRWHRPLAMYAVRVRKMRNAIETNVT